MVAPFFLFYKNSIHIQSAISLLVISPGRIFWWQEDLPGKTISWAQNDPLDTGQKWNSGTAEQTLLFFSDRKLYFAGSLGIGYHKEGVLLVTISILLYVLNWCPWEKTCSYCFVIRTCESNKESSTSAFPWGGRKRELDLQSSYSVVSG